MAGWLLGVMAAVAGEAIPASGLAWAWPDGETRRWYVEDEVTLPQFMMWRAERNIDVRVIAWQLRAVMSCTPVPERTGRRSWEIACAIDDASVRAACLPADSGPAAGDEQGRTRLGVVVDEYDQRLSAATVQFTLRKDGRIASVDLEGVPKRLDRHQAIYESLRQIVLRAVAGLDVGLPRKGESPDGLWVQYQNLLLAAPANTGSPGGTETVHQVLRSTDGLVVTRVVGRGIVAPSQGGDTASDNFDTRLEGATVFDTNRGLVAERVWTVLGEATASSALAEGFSKSVPYIQRGRLVSLAAGEKVELPTSIELAPPGGVPSTLQLGWVSIDPLAGW